MKDSLFARRFTLAAVLALVSAAAACDSTQDLLAPEDAPVVVLGRVASVTHADPNLNLALASSSGTLGGIEVSVEGELATDVTDDSGNFRLEVKEHDGRIRIRFRRGPLDVRLEIEGASLGTLIQLEVVLADRGATLLSSHDSRDHDFDGTAALVSVEGDAPSRTARVELTNVTGSEFVDIVEGVTLFDNEGDILSFADLLAALDRADVTVKIEGEGERQDDGAITASEIKAETDQDDNDDDDNDDEAEGPDDFDGTAALVSVDGDAPSRTARVELTNVTGSEFVDIVEGATLFDNEGDILSFADLLAALDRADVTVKIEGEGERQDDGAITASEIKAETDQDDNDDDDNDDETEGPDDFDGTAALVSVDGDAPSRTARVELTNVTGSELVDIVEGVTLFDNEGDILSFADLMAALDRADLTVKIEGEGERQDDGAITASEIKAETDGDDDENDDDEDDQTEGPDEFDGTAALVSVDGDAPSRTARVELTNVTGSEFVDIVEGVTLFDNEGDILSFADLLAALDRADLTVKIEGEGERQDDGAITASEIKAETEEGS